MADANETNDNQMNGAGTEFVNQVSNVNAEDIDKETNEKLKGDAIGETLYSQSFVLKTLLQLSDLKWSEEFEEDLCFLWDMTVEKDVCEYLFQISYPSIACTAVMKYSENRFIEIVIGILANIMCVGSDSNVTEEEIVTILNQLESDDHLILIQVIRFLDALAHSRKELPFISNQVLVKIKFILENSVNTELISKTLEALTKLTIDCKLDKDFVDIDLFQAVVTAYRTVVNSEDSFDLGIKDNILTCKHFLQNISNICTYADNFENHELLLEIRRHSTTYVGGVDSILEYFSHKENLWPLSDEFIFFMSVFRYTLVMLNINYDRNIFLSLTKILILTSSTKDEIADFFDNVLELECFLISRSNSEQLLHDLKHISKHKVKIVFNIVNESQHSYEYKLNMPDLLMKFK